MTTTENTTFSIPGTSDVGKAVFVSPAGEGPHPAVLVLPEILGLNDDMARIAGLFADAGYAAMAPDYFGDGFKIGCIVSAMRALNKGEGDPFDRIEAARVWLTSRDDVDADRVGAVGFCMGGGFAILHAARADLKAVATYYGDVPKAAADLQGIPPCIGGFGGRDRLFRGKADVLEGHLETLGVTHDIKTYADAGHSYMSDNSGFLATVGAWGPMNVGHDADAAADSWRRMLDFFGEHIGR